VDILHGANNNGFKKKLPILWIMQSIILLKYHEKKIDDILCLTSLYTIV
jgi:hypothetical protein